MSNPRDDDASAPGAAQPRKPRIEVLRTAPAAMPIAGPARDAASSAPPAASPTQPSWNAPDEHRHADTRPAARRRGLLGSRTALLMILAAVILAGLVLYTYVVNERDAGERTQVSSADVRASEDVPIARDVAESREAVAPPAAIRVEELAPESVPDASLPPKRVAAPAPSQAASDEAPEERSSNDPSVAADDGGAPDAVRAFYAALSLGDGASAAQFVVPEKRQSGPLSAGALSRYYSSFRRPLRVRRVAPVDADTTRVAYDYVLADGRLCRGEATVDVARRGIRSLVSRIRTQGPC